MTNNKLPYTHLLYVCQYSISTNNYELFVIGVNTKDIFHTIGEYLYRCETKVERINPIECTQLRLDYWKENGHKIYEFKDKYTIQKKERK